jgi:hypothetical protein
MGEFRIEPGRVLVLSGSLGRVSSSLQRARERIVLALGLDPLVLARADIRHRIVANTSALGRAETAVRSMRMMTSASAIRYAQVEQRLMGAALLDVARPRYSVTDLMTMSGLLGFGPFGILAGLLFLGGEGRIGDEDNGASRSYLDWELGGSSATGYLAKDEMHWRSGAASGKVEAYAGKAEAAWNPLTIGLYSYNPKTGKMELDPGVSTSVGISVTALSLSTQTEYGDRNLGVEAEAEGEIGSADAGFEGGIGLDDKTRQPEAYVKAEAGASVFKGEVSGGFNIFGIHIGIGAHGDAVGVGAEGQIGYHDGKYKIGGGVTCGVGGGIDLEIGFAD